MAGVKINTKLWTERLDKKIDELSRLGKREYKKVVESAMDHYLRAVQHKRA